MALRSSFYNSGLWDMPWASRALTIHVQKMHFVLRQCVNAEDTVARVRNKEVRMGSNINLVLLRAPALALALRPSNRSVLQECEIDMSTKHRSYTLFTPAVHG